MAGRGDISITALYTAEVWRWGGFAGADLVTSDHSRAVFRITNAALGVTRAFRRDMPRLRHSLVQRHAMLDRLARQSTAPQVLELAAGLSPRGATMSADPRVDRYVEVDLPDMVAAKRDALGRSAAGRAVLARDNLELVSGDLETVDLAALVTAGKPVCVIAEGILMYLDQAQQQALWRRVAELLRANGGELLFDLVPRCEQPPPGRAGRILESLFKRFTRGQTFAFDRRTRSNLEEELHACGFDGVELFEPGAVARAWELPYPGAHTQVLIWRARA
jgi:O-methyltransferase involved in polyketide biosynthesis